MGLVPKESKNKPHTPALIGEENNLLVGLNCCCCHGAVGKRGDDKIHLAVRVDTVHCSTAAQQHNCLV